jgi:2,3-bisphosphoglycerate-independent phosphoglycerate mutase
MDPIKERLGLQGYTISAVDLIHGIGRAIGLSPLHVDGVTGYIDTNYTGKADALLEAMKTSNFVFLHVESPDESGHEGNLGHKLKAIEDFDEKVVGKIMKGLKDFDDYTVLVISDHPTPVSLRTHTGDPVPFCIYSNKKFSNFTKPAKNISGYNETSAAQTGIHIEDGHRLIKIMINKKL